MKTGRNHVTNASLNQSMSEKKKRGRPVSLNPRKNSLRVRLTDEDLEKLWYITSVLDLSMSDILRHGIGILYEKAQKEAEK